MENNTSVSKNPVKGRINRLAALLLLLIGIMLIVIFIPSWKVFRFRSEKTACIQALKSAEDGLIIDFLSTYQEDSVEHARQTLDAVLPERPNICPAGGTVYLIKGNDGIYKPVCGLHDSDLKERTRLNSTRAMDLLLNGLAEAKENGDAEPDSVTIRLNGRDLEIMRVEKEEPIRRGTGTTYGYEGTVAYFGLAGTGEEDFKYMRNPKDRIVYFLYADEEHCAVWRVKDGWTGTAFTSY